MRAVLTFLLTLFAPAVNASELRITVEGIRSPQGTILLGLYDSFESFTRAIELSDKDGFLNDPSRFAAVALRANAAMKSAVVLTNLDPGQYTIILFHDENGNGKLDKNALGVPTEPYGFSNNCPWVSRPSTPRRSDHGSQRRRQSCSHCFDLS